MTLQVLEAQTGKTGDLPPTAHRVGHDFVIHGLQAIRERKRFAAACLIILYRPKGI